MTIVIGIFLSFVSSGNFLVTLGAISYPESSGFWPAGERTETLELWNNGRDFPRRREDPVSVRMLEIRTKISYCPITSG